MTQSRNGERTVTGHMVGAATRAPLALDPPAWLAGRAACREADPETFFPRSYNHEAETTVSAAREVCGGCELRAACLEWAVDHPSLDGIWGGSTPLERRRARVRRGSAA